MVRGNAFSFEVLTAGENNFRDGYLDSVRNMNARSDAFFENIREGHFAGGMVSGKAPLTNSTNYRMGGILLAGGGQVNSLTYPQTEPKQD